MKKLLLLLTLLLFTSSALASAIGPSVGSEANQSEKTSGEDSMTRKKSREQKQSDSNKKSTSVSTGRDKTDQESFKKADSAVRNAAIDVKVSMQTYFFYLLQKWEDEGREPFASWGVLTNPKYPRDFGLDAVNSRGGIDSIKAGMLDKAAKSNMTLDSVYADEAALKAYTKNVGKLGVIVGQAFMNLSADLVELDVVLPAKGKDATPSILLTEDDFLLLAESALTRAAEEGPKGSLKWALDGLLADDKACRFDGATDKIRCGRNQITLTARPTLQSGGVQLFGEAFGGYSADYKVSSGLSYTKAFEQVASTSSYSKFAKETVEAREKLLAQGKVKEAVFVTKESWDKARSGKVGMNASIPQI